MMTTKVENSTGSNSSLDLCESFGEVYNIQGSSTIESKLRFVEFSYEFAVFITIVNVTLPVCALLGNSLVVATIFAHRVLRVIPANLFLLSLATTDFLVGAIVQPAFAYGLILGLLPNHGKCIVDARVIVELFGGCCITVSLGSLCLVTMDRFVAIQNPLRYHALVTKKRAACLIAAVWFLGVTLTIGARLTATHSIVAVQALWWGFVISACLVMVTAHIKIWSVSRKHAHKIYSEHSRFENTRVTLRTRRALETVIIVSLCLFICYLPYVILAVEKKMNADIKSSDHSLTHDVMFRVALTLLTANSSLSPGVYFLRSPKLRAYACKLLPGGRRRWRNVKSAEFYLK